MNEFTKDELKFIAIALERFTVKQPELEKQIQSMIDNYCEHECPSCGRKIILDTVE